MARNVPSHGLRFGLSSILFCHKSSSFSPLSCHTAPIFGHMHLIGHHQKQRFNETADGLYLQYICVSHSIIPYQAWLPVGPRHAKPGSKGSSQDSALSHAPLQAQEAATGVGVQKRVGGLRSRAFVWDLGTKASQDH